MASTSTLRRTIAALGKGQAPGHYAMVPRFFSSDLWREIQRDLDSPNIPSSVRNTADSLAVIRAGLALTSVAVVLDAARDGIDTRAYSIVTDCMQSIWCWLWFLHPAKRSEAECELIYVVAARYAYDQVVAYGDSATWLGDTVVAIFARLAYGRDRLTDAVLAHDDAYAFAYGVWEYIARRNMSAARIDVALRTITVISRRAPRRMLDEIQADGTSGTRLLIRRLHNLARSAKLSPRDQLDLYNVVETLYLCTDSDVLRPQLMRALSSIGGALCALKDRNTEKSTDPYHAGYATHCCRLILELTHKHLIHVRTICRMIRGGLLQGLRICLDRVPDTDSDITVPQHVGLILDDVITPTLVFKSVLREVEHAHAHDPLLKDEAEGDGHDEWNVMVSNFLDRSQLLQESLQEEALRTCNNPECRTSGKSVKRCGCGEVYYCSKDCQRLDRALHRKLCDSIYEPERDDSAICSPSDIWFARLCAKKAFRRLVAANEITSTGSAILDIDLKYLSIDDYEAGVARLKKHKSSERPAEMKRLEMKSDDIDAFQFPPTHRICIVGASTMVGSITVRFKVGIFDMDSPPWGIGDADADGRHDLAT